MQKEICPVFLSPKMRRRLQGIPQMAHIVSVMVGYTREGGEGLGSRGIDFF